MFEAVVRPKTHEKAGLWLLKTILGLLLIVVLGIHFGVNHLVMPHGLLSYHDVIVYYSNPLITLMEICFLVFVITHALLGVRSILMDLNPSEKALSIIDKALLMLGLAACAYGIGLALIISSRAM